MKLWSDSWANGEAIPPQFAAGRLDDQGKVGFSDNLSPHLAWREVPAGCLSLALICHDLDVPSKGEDVNKDDREVPADLPRVDFFHWLLVDIPPTISQLPQGLFSSNGLTARGKPGPLVSVPGFESARQGLNDYTGWFAGDPDMAGEYFGYDGPFPPFNDSLVHHYVFTLFALSVVRAPVDGHFTGAALREALVPHTLASAALSGSYTLNKRLAFSA